MDYIDRVAAGLADCQRGVFARWQLVANGIPIHLIKARVEARRWVIVFPGVYRMPGSGTSFVQQLAAARLAAGPDAVVGGQGAAALFELPAIPKQLEILAPYSVVWKVPGVVVRRTRQLSWEDVCEHEGVPVTTIPRTVMDLCGRFGKGRMEVVVDDLLPAGRVTWANLHGQLERRARRGVKGTAMFRALLEERRGENRPLNRFERKMGRVLVDGGLPLPVFQYEVVRDDGGRYFLDGAYPELLVGAECLSQRWHSSLSARRRDTQRAEELRAMGWLIVPIYWDELDEQPHVVVARMREARDARLSVHTAGV